MEVSCEGLQDEVRMQSAEIVALPKPTFSSCTTLPLIVLKDDQGSRPVCVTSFVSPVFPKPLPHLPLQRCDGSEGTENRYNETGSTLRSIKTHRTRGNYHNLGTNRLSNKPQTGSRTQLKEETEMGGAGASQSAVNSQVLLHPQKHYQVLQRTHRRPRQGTRKLVAQSVGLDSNRNQERRPCRVEERDMEEKYVHCPKSVPQMEWDPYFSESDPVASKCHLLFPRGPGDVRTADEDTYLAEDTSRRMQRNQACLERSRRAQDHAIDYAKSCQARAEAKLEATHSARRLRIRKYEDSVKALAATRIDMMIPSRDRFAVLASGKSSGHSDSASVTHPKVFSFYPTVHA